MDRAWSELLRAEAAHSRTINSEIRKWAHIVSLSLLNTHGLFSIKEALRQQFARAANDFENQLRIISSQISVMVGPLEVGIYHRVLSFSILLSLNIPPVPAGSNRSNPSAPCPANEIPCCSSCYRGRARGGKYRRERPYGVYVTGPRV